MMQRRRRWRPAAAMAMAMSMAVVAMVACSTEHRPAETVDTDSPAPPPAATASASGADRYQTVCAGCHIGGASAPEMREVAAAYRTRHGSDSAAAAAIAAFVRAPSAEASLLPEAVEQFGLMPAIPLEAAELDAVAAHALTVQ